MGQHTHGSAAGSGGWRRISNALGALSKAPSLRSGSKIAENLGKIVALVTAVLTALTYVLSAPERTRQVDYAAWQLINASHGQRGSAGRVEALEALAQNGVPLDGVDVSGAFLDHLRLVGASLRQAKFTSANLRRAVFDAADLSGADFRHAVTIDERDEPTIDIDNLPAPTVTSFLNAALSEADFSGKSNLPFSDFRVTRKRDDPTLGSFSPFREDGRTVFDDAAVDYSRFDGRKFIQASFRRASANTSTFIGFTALQSDFRDSNFSNGKFRNARLDSSDFRNADLAGDDFTNATLESSYFRNADLSGSDFTNAKLNSVDFSGACLRGAVFSGTLVEKANFAGAIMDTATDFRGARYLDTSRDTLVKSILRAIDYRRAKFDGGLAEALTRAASRPDSAPTVASGGGPGHASGVPVPSMPGRKRVAIDEVAPARQSQANQVTLPKASACRS